LLKAYKKNQKIQSEKEHLASQLDSIQSYLVEGKFHIGDILTACSDRMLAPKKEEGLRELAEYMTGQTVDMQNLKQVIDTLVPELKKQFPWINDIPFDQCNESNWKEFRDKFAQKYGEYLNVNVVY
jgi:hypothetical protein